MQTPILTAILALGHLMLVSGGLALWRLVVPGGFEFPEISATSDLPVAKPTEGRFSLLHLMGWTTIAAILCAIGGQVFRDRMDDFLRSVRDLVAIIAITSSGAAVGAIQVIALSRQESRLTNLVLAIFAIPAISLVELAILSTLEEINSRQPSELFEMGVILGSMNAIHAVVVWVTYGILYVGGLRWVEPGEFASEKLNHQGQGPQ